MKSLFTILFLIATTASIAQDADKAVTIVVSGQGQTTEDAKNNALRNAIEQAFGAFISSKTEIVNDNLIKDEIISITSGNIQKYEVLTEVVIPSAGFATTLKATVSVSKLTSFCERKGFEIEFKGSLFAFNAEQQKLNEKNELIAINDVLEISKKLLEKSFSANLNAGEPLSAGGDLYYLPTTIDISVNDNANASMTYLYENIKKIAMTQDEVSNYLKVNKPVYPFTTFKSLEPVNVEIKFWEWDYNTYNGRLNSLAELTFAQYVDNKKRKYSNANSIIKGGMECKYRSDLYTHQILYFRNSQTSERIYNLIENSISSISRFAVKSNLGNVKFELKYIGGVIPIHETEEYRAFELYNKRGFDIAYSSSSPGFWSNSAVFENKKYTKDMNQFWTDFRKNRIFDETYSQNWKPVVIHEFKNNTVVCKAFINIILSLDEMRKTSALTITME
jgi:hypothetical protein